MGLSRLDADRRALAARWWPWACRLARDHGRRIGWPWDDLTGPAAEALCRAAAGYDPRRGVYWHVYARSLILGRLRSHVRDESRRRCRRLPDLDRPDWWLGYAGTAYQGRCRAARSEAFAALLVGPDLGTVEAAEVAGKAAGILPPRQHEALRRHCSGETWAEVGAAMGLSQRGAQTLGRRALLTLRAALAGRD